MKRLLLGVALLIPLLSSGCQSTTGAPTTVLTAEDLRFIDTLRELDERSDAIVRTANFGSEHPELKAFADAAGHAHHKRSENIKRWRESSFPAAPIIVAMSVCGESDYRTSPPHATDLQIIDRFIAHRECALGFVVRTLPTIRSSGARHLAEEAAHIFDSELQQLRTWRSAWQ